MEIVYKKISELIPYVNNSRTHSEEQIKQIASSIKEYNFTNPILIDENNGVIAGHGRIEGAKLLNMVEVPCIVLEGLTEAQKKAYIIADNKMALNAGWNEDLLKLELENLKELDFDLELTGFSDKELDDILFPIEKENERQRTNDKYNLDLINIEENSNNFWQMPIIKKENFIPKDLIGFNYAKSNKNKNVGIHFYVDDYQFERVWNKPQQYIDILKEYDCILSPDFSLYLDMPMPMKIWNIYRSRQIGRFYQDYGIKVIPTLSWAEEETFDFAFEGLEQNGTISISTIGIKRNEEAYQIWAKGAEEAIKRLQPKNILLYGGKVDFDFKDINVVCYENKVTEKFKKGET